MPKSIYDPVDIRLAPSNLDPYLPPVAVTFDWLMTPLGQLDPTYALVTAVIVALGTDRLAEDDDILPGIDDNNRRGWWGDLDPEIHDSWPIGTRLWLLERHKITGDRAKQGSSTARAREYAYEALQPFIDRGICREIEVTAVRNAIDKIDITVTLIRGPEPNLTLRYAALWSDIITPPAPPERKVRIREMKGRASGTGSAVGAATAIAASVGLATGVGIAASSDFGLMIDSDIMTIDVDPFIITD